MIFFSVGVMYSGEYDACDVTLSVYPHTGIEHTTFGILAQYHILEPTACSKTWTGLISKTWTGLD